MFSTRVYSIEFVMHQCGGEMDFKPETCLEDFLSGERKKRLFVDERIGRMDRLRRGRSTVMSSHAAPAQPSLQQ